MHWKGQSHLVEDWNCRIVHGWTDGRQAVDSQQEPNIEQPTCDDDHSFLLFHPSLYPINTSTEGITV